MKHGFNEPMHMVFVPTINFYKHFNIQIEEYWGRRDRVVVGIITTYAISAYHH
jgi:hypothetical protein